MKVFGIRKELFGLILATITVVTIVAVYIYLALQDREAYHWVTQTYENQTRLEQTLLDIESAQDAHESYRISRNPEALVLFHAALQKVDVDLEALQRALIDSPELTFPLRRLQKDVAAFRLASDSPTESRTTNGTPLVQELVSLEEVHRSADGMRQAEQDLLEQRTQTNRLSQRHLNVALVAFLITVTLLLIALFHAVRQELVQRIAAERLRHEADQKVAHVLENMSDGFYAVNREWVVTYMNRRAEQILNLARSETLGKRLWELYPDAVDTEFGEQYRRARDEQVSVRFEAFYPSHSTWYEISAFPHEDGLAIFFANVTERRRAEEEQEQRALHAMLHVAAQRRNQELTILARRLVEIQEAERGHLAYELHEEIGQVLAGLKLSLASMMKQPDDMRNHQIQAAQDLVTELMRHVRTLSLDLRPGVLDDLGLRPALEWYCKHYTEQTEVVVDFAVSGLDLRLDGTVETTAYRIVQEALANVAQHSGVKAVEVRIALQEECLTLQISDHGLGNTLGSAECFCDHSTLTAMQERATLIGGVFEVTTALNQGTIIVVQLPVQPVYTSLES